MRVLKERRQPKTWRLRVYIDAIKDAEATTDSQWTDNWSRHHGNCAYLSKNTWISLLKYWALKEAEILTLKKAA